MSGQITDELMGIDLGDKRLNQRSRQIMESLSVYPQASVNASFDNWATRGDRKRVATAGRESIRRVSPRSGISSGIYAGVNAPSHYVRPVYGPQRIYIVPHGNPAVNGRG